MGEARHRAMRLKVGNEAVSDDPATLALELRLAKSLVDTVLAEYPGYVWGVEVNFAGKVATLKLPYLMQSSHCYCIHLDSVTSFPDMQKIMRKAGGELLERFRLDRAGYNVTNFQEARKLALTDHKQKMPE